MRLTMRPTLRVVSRAWPPFAQAAQLQIHKERRSLRLACPPLAAARRAERSAR